MPRLARSESEGGGLDASKDELRGNCPNPSGQATITYTLKSKRPVTVEICDLLGRQVRTLVRGEKQEAGLHRLPWQGHTRCGEPAGSGLYFYRIEAEGFTEMRKMVLVR